MPKLDISALLVSEKKNEVSAINILNDNWNKIKSSRNKTEFQSFIFKLIEKNIKVAYDLFYSFYVNVYKSMKEIGREKPEIKPPKDKSFMIGIPETKESFDYACSVSWYELESFKNKSKSMYSFHKKYTNSIDLAKNSVDMLAEEARCRTYIVRVLRTMIARNTQLGQFKALVDEWKKNK